MVIVDASMAEGEMDSRTREMMPMLELRHFFIHLFQP
jgi:hypothetical protein